jgi:CubicO group peptidase (beta-lactamase class C family)
MRVEFDEATIDALFASLDQCHLPGAAVGIAIRGRPVYRKGFGLAHLELPMVLTTSMRMRIASASKQFTALAYMLLCEEGKAQLNDRVLQYIPELNPVAREVTMRQLMAHTSGLRDPYDISYHFSGLARPITSQHLLELYRDLDTVNFPPGTAWSYNNGGCLLLTLAIERIADEPFEDVLRQRIFDPLGMHDSRLRRWDTDFVPNSATLHMLGAGGAFEKSYVNKEHTGEGGIVSTVDDLLRWLAHMDHPRVGTATTWEHMCEPYRLINGFSTGYGLGLIVGEYRGARTISHSGTLLGCSAQVLKVPHAALDIVMISNRHDVSSVAGVAAILDACLPDLAVRHTMDGFAPTGTFQSARTGRIVQVKGSNSAPVLSVNGWDVAAYWDAAGVLRPSMSLYRWALTPLGDPHEPAAVSFNEFGHCDEFQRVAPSRDVKDPDIEGVYRCAALEIQLSIEATDAGITLRSERYAGSVIYALEPLAEDSWRAETVPPSAFGGVVRVAQDRRSLQFWSGRTWGLEFVRER